MLLPVLPFMTKSNPDLTLNLVSPLGFPGSLRLVTLLLLPAMSNGSITPTPQPRCEGNFFQFAEEATLSQKMLGLKKVEPWARYTKGEWRLLRRRWRWCVSACEHTESSGHIMRESAGPPSCHHPLTIPTLPVHCTTPGASHAFQGVSGALWS